MEKMPGNGKKTIARGFDGLDEALKKNGFHPEKIVDPASHGALEQPETEQSHVSQEVPQQESPSSETNEEQKFLEESKNTLRETVAAIEMAEDLRAQYYERIERTVSRGGIRTLVNELTKRSEADKELEHIRYGQNNLRERLAKLDLDPQVSASFASRIDTAATQKVIRRISLDLHTYEAPEVNDADKKPVETPASASPEVPPIVEEQKAPEPEAVPTPELPVPHEKEYAGPARLMTPEEMEAMRKKFLERISTTAQKRVTTKKATKPKKAKKGVPPYVPVGPTGPKVPQYPQGPWNIPNAPVNSQQQAPGSGGVPPTVFRGQLSRGVHDPSAGSHESIHHEKISNMDEILSNPRRQVMLGEFLKAQGQDGLIEKYHKGQEDPSAWPISENLVLKKMLRAFDKRFAAVESLKAGLTKGDVEAFVRDNTEFGFMEISTNSERTFELMRDALDHTLMVMPENEYAGVVDTMLKTNAIRNDYRFKAMTERARKAAKDENISPEDLKWDSVQKNSFLLNAIRRPKFLDWAFGDESSKNSQEMLDAIKYNRKVAGVLLASTIQNDPLLKKRLLEEVHTRNKAPDTAAQGTASYEGVLTENQKLAALDAMQPDKWTDKLKDAAFQKLLMPKGNWATSSEVEREAAFSDHIQRSGGEIHIRRGWLARITLAIFGAGVRKTVESLKTQGAFK